jgi:hypothetical protein
VRKAAQWKPAVCDPVRALRSQMGCGGGAFGSHATHGRPAARLHPLAVRSCVVASIPIKRPSRCPRIPLRIRRSGSAGAVLDTGTSTPRRNSRRSSARDRSVTLSGALAWMTPSGGARAGAAR